MYAHRRRFFSATMKEMTGSAGTSGTGCGPKVTPGFDLGSVNVVDLSPKPPRNQRVREEELRCGLGQPQRLLAEDQAHEIFGYLPETYSLWHRLRYHGWSTLRYLMQTEVHTYAFSVAANSILSFFPFIVLLLTLVHRVLHSAAMYDVVLQLLRNYLPSNKDFVIRNLQFLASVRGHDQVLSFVMLLNVRIDRDFPAARSRSQQYLGLQEEPFLLDEPDRLAGSDARVRMFGRVVDRADGTKISVSWNGSLEPENFVFQGLGFVVMKASAIITTIAIYFLIYWLLPNGKVQFTAVLPAAVITEIISEETKFPLHHRAALAQFSGSLRSLLGDRDANLLVVLQRNVIAGRSLSVSRRA